DPIPEVEPPVQIRVLVSTRARPPPILRARSDGRVCWHAACSRRTGSHAARHHSSHDHVPVCHPRLLRRPPSHLPPPPHPRHPRPFPRPRPRAHVRPPEPRLEISPSARVRWVHDVFGNSIAVATFAEPAAEMRLVSTIRLEHFPAIVLEFPIEAYARTHPF